MVEVGDVLFLHVDDTDPPKNKYFFILGENEGQISLASFYVNSKINFNVNNNPVLVQYNIELNISDYPFLHHLSYLDCTKITVRDKEEYNNIINARPDAIVYKLTEDQLEFFRQVIREVPTIKGKIKKQFGFFNK